MDLAPRAVHEPITCDLCEGSFVLFEGDKVCLSCGYISGSEDDDSLSNPWERWRDIRNTKYEEDKDCRRRVVGAYAHAYFDDDGNVIT